MLKNQLIEKLKKRKEKKQDIKQLLKMKKYEDIYIKYGQKAYIKATPYKVKKKDMQELFEQGRYEDIYIKYGEKIYNSYLTYMREVDVQTETGSKFKGFIEMFKYWLKIELAPLLLSVGLLSASGMPVVLATTSEGVRRENEIKYSKEIEEYNHSIEAYAKEIKELNLTDTQIFVKLMYDLWNDIEGYKTPEKYDDIGVFRLSVEKENIGVCRNFSDDLAARLNAINPKYNARTLGVYMSGDSEYKFAKIERNIVESGNESENENKEESDKEGENANNDENFFKKEILRKSCCYCG